MEAIGIIAEYNPFHNGHLWHLKETKKNIDLPIIVVMSGSIMQRGEPAFCDKWLRARMTVECGVDLVLELPTAFSIRSAEFFAKGGVQLLQSTGIVNYLSCGAEDANIDYTVLAQQMLSTPTQTKIADLIKQGFPYAKACQLALPSASSALACKPNNILALEYAKALLNTDIRQLVIPRKGSNYNDVDLSSTASATAVRQAYKQGSSWQNSVPEIVAQILSERRASVGWSEQKLWQLLIYRLRICTSAQLLAETECTEGLENLLLATANTTSFNEAVASCTNKRYPASRIRRLFLQLLMAKPVNYFKQAEPAYLRVLAFSEVGRRLLAEMKHKAALPIITKLGRNPYQNQSETFKQQLELDITASNVTALLRNLQQNTASDFLVSPYYKK